MTVIPIDRKDIYVYIFINYTITNMQIVKVLIATKLCTICLNSYIRIICLT